MWHGGGFVQKHRFSEWHNFQIAPKRMTYFMNDAQPLAIIKRSTHRYLLHIKRIIIIRFENCAIYHQLKFSSTLFRMLLIASTKGVHVEQALAAHTLKLLQVSTRSTDARSLLKLEFSVWETDSQVHLCNGNVPLEKLKH